MDANKCPSDAERLHENLPTQEKSSDSSMVIESADTDAKLMEGEDTGGELYGASNDKEGDAEEEKGEQGGEQGEEQEGEKEGDCSSDGEIVAPECELSSGSEIKSDEDNDLEGLFIPDSEEEDEDEEDKEGYNIAGHNKRKFYGADGNDDNNKETKRMRQAKDDKDAS